MFVETIITQYRLYILFLTFLLLKNLYKTETTVKFSS